MIIAVTAALISVSVGLAAAAPLQLGLSSNVKSDLLLVNRNNNGVTAGQGGVGGLSGRVDKPDVPAGQALDLFYRFGFFSLSVRVVPRDDSGSWLIREPTAALFDPTTVSERITPSGDGRFDGRFQVYFCDDVAELNEAYFRDFSADRIEQPHKLFTGSWHASTKSKYYGLSKESFDGQSSFVLIKLPKKRLTISAGGAQGRNSMRLKPDVQAAMNGIQIGNPNSVLSFLEDYGSHYLQDIVVGDVLYQVIALDRDQYRAAKASVASLGGLASPADFGRFYNSHLAPWLVRETGKVGVASGDRAVASILESELNTSGMFGSYPNLLVMADSPELTARLEAATESTEAVVGLNFASLRGWVRDPQVREYYDEIVDTHMALWEANMRR